MPKGVPNTGYRMTKNRMVLLNKGGNADEFINTYKHKNDDYEIEDKNYDENLSAERIKDRFVVLDYMTNSCVKGNCRSLIVSGPPGLGKSYSVEHILKEWDSEGDQHEIIKGYIRPTGLYKALFQHRALGSVLVFDDADNIFNDEVSLNLLKSVCDTTERRVVSWRSETRMFDSEEAVNIPTSFVFEGTIIFITNLDFDKMIDKGNKIGAHLGALMSRSHYIDLGMKCAKDYLIRIKQVMKDNDVGEMLAGEKEDVMEFVNNNYTNLRELSIRTIIKLADIRKTSPIQWEKVARITCCR